MAAPDKEALFSIFGLDVTATRGEVCKRYKELALKHHPDKNPGSATAKDLMQIYTNARDAILDKIVPEPNGSSFEEFVDEEHKELQGHWQWDASSGQRGAKRKWRDYGDESNVIFEHNAKKGRVEFDPDAPGTGKQVKCDGGLFARRVRVLILWHHRPCRIVRCPETSGAATRAGAYAPAQHFRGVETSTAA